MTPKIVEHNNIYVVRDDLFPGGTKTRIFLPLYQIYPEIVYASPAQGGAQTALAHAARQSGQKATIFVAKRSVPHPRALEGKRVGAKIYQVSPGYLTVVQSRAKAYCKATGAHLLPFGADTPESIDIIAQAATAIGIQPDEIWCASGSGVLMRGMTKAWPNARRHAVQIGRTLTAKDVAGAKIHIYPKSYDFALRSSGPFPADPHYDAKAWDVCLKQRGPGTVLFWNVTGPANA